MSKKKPLPTGVQAHIDRIQAAGDLRVLDAIFSAIEAACGSKDDRTAMDAGHREVWRAYRARYIDLAGTEPPIPGDPCASAEEQAAFREAVARLASIKQEVELILMQHPNPGPHQTPDVRALERILSGLADATVPMAAKCRAVVRRSSFKVVQGLKP